MSPEKNELIKNGFVVKSYEELYVNELNNYCGIGRYFTWPLNV